jgi:hypothetical protein
MIINSLVKWCVYAVHINIVQLVYLGSLFVVLKMFSLVKCRYYWNHLLGTDTNFISGGRI